MDAGASLAGAGADTADNDNEEVGNDLVGKASITC